MSYIVVYTHIGDCLTLITYNRTTDEVAAPSESTATAASKVNISVYLNFRRACTARLTVCIYLVCLCVCLCVSVDDCYCATANEVACEQCQQLRGATGTGKIRWKFCRNDCMKLAGSQTRLYMAKLNQLAMHMHFMPCMHTSVWLSDDSWHFSTFPLACVCSVGPWFESLV